MTKRSKITLFGLLALIAAFGLVLTGCPDAAGSTEYVPTPDDVRLAAGSHGHADGNTIIGLATGSVYVIRTGDKWYGVDEDGKLVKTHDTLLDALTNATALGTGVTTITGLTKGTRYNVYLKDPTAPADAAVIINAALTDGRNTIVDTSAISTDTNTITIAAGASKVGGSVVVLLNATGAVVAENGGPVTNYNRIRGNTGGKTYQFNSVSGAATFETVPIDGKYIVFNGIQSNFTAVIKPSAVVATALVAAAEGSYAGTGALTEINTITSGKYVVQNRNKWYSVIGSGTACTLVAANPNTPVAAAEGTTATDTTKITGLTNDEVYNLYKYVPVTAEVDSSAEVKNTVYAYNGNVAIKFGSSAGHGKNTYIFIVDGVITGGTQTSGELIDTGNTVTTADHTYTLNGGGGTFAANGAKLSFTTGQKYFTVTGGGSSTIFGFTRT